MLFYLTRDDDSLATRHSQGAIEGTPKVFAPEALCIIGFFRCTVIIFGAPWRPPKSFCKDDPQKNPLSVPLTVPKEPKVVSA